MKCLILFFCRGRLSALLVVQPKFCEKSLIKKIEEIHHTVGTCYKDHGLIEPTLSKQWFIKVEPLAKEALKTIKNKKVKFVAKQYEKIPMLYEMLIAQEPDNYGFYANLAATYAELGDKPKALKFIKKKYSKEELQKKEINFFVDSNLVVQTLNCGWKKKKNK